MTELQRVLNALGFKTSEESVKKIIGTVCHVKCLKF